MKKLFISIFLLSLMAVAACDDPTAEELYGADQDVQLSSIGDDDDESDIPPPGGN